MVATATARGIVCLIAIIPFIPQAEGGYCDSSRWRDVDISLRNRYKNENTPSTPSYLNNGFLVHGFECLPTDAGINCYGHDFDLYNESVRWSNVCEGTPQNYTPNGDSVFCPTGGDWLAQKQAKSFSYIRKDLPWQGIWVAGGYIDAGFIFGAGTLGNKGTMPRCFWQGDANTGAREGGGCGGPAPTGQGRNTTSYPAGMYEVSCQEKFKGVDKPQWKQVFQTANCPVMTNIDAGASSSDPVVQGYIADLKKESTNPFDDMYANFSSCAPNCVPGAFANEVLIPCCKSIESMQPDAGVRENNWPALTDLDIIAIFYVVNQRNDVPLATKKKATRRMSELLAQATGKAPVPLVGIDQDLLASRKSEDPGIFVCDEQAQASMTTASEGTAVLI